MSRQLHELDTGNVLDRLPNTVLKELLHLTLEASAASASGGSADSHVSRIKGYLASHKLGYLDVSVQDGQVLIRPQVKQPTSW